MENHGDGPRVRLVRSGAPMKLTTSPSPFVPALGASLAEVAPAVRRHLSMESPRCQRAGFLRRSWRRRGLFPWLVGWALSLRQAPQGEARPSFLLRNQLVEQGGGAAAMMIWSRVTRVGASTKVAIGHMRWDPRRGVLLDSTGPLRRMDVELVPTVDAEGAVLLSSHRQWLCFFGLRLPLPAWLVGSARTREWEEPGGEIGLSLTLEHPLLGPYAGYEAILEGSP